MADYVLGINAKSYDILIKRTGAGALATGCILLAYAFPTKTLLVYNTFFQVQHPQSIEQ